MFKRMASRNITDRQRTLGALLRAPYERLQKRVYGGLAARGFADIRPAHSSLFRTIAPEGSSVSDLADRAQITKQSMAYIVEDLESGGYVTTRPDAKDRRAKRVMLTAKGLKAWDALIVLSAEAEADVARKIGREAVKTLRELLTKITDD